MRALNPVAQDHQIPLPILFVRNNYEKFGFTLIELLVVIAIVGILVAVGSISYLTASKQSRDTRRKTDLEQIRQALKLIVQKQEHILLLPHHSRQIT